MAAKNQTKVQQGGTVTLEVAFRLYSGGPLTDPDTVPTFTIKDPNNVIMATGDGTKTAIGCYTATYVSSETAEVSDQWKIEWVATINSFVVPDSWEYFEVVTSGSASFTNILIADNWLKQVKKVLAYPSLDKAILSDDEIIDYCVHPALVAFFTKFPLKTTTQQGINGEVVINFPDIYTIGVMDVRVVDIGLIYGTGTSFWDLVSYNVMGASGSMNPGQMFGAKGYNPNSLWQQRMFQRQVAKSLQNQNATIKARVNPYEKKVYIYSSISGTLNIIWAKYSVNFDDIKFERKYDVIKLAQAYLLEHLADTTSILNDSNLDITVNADTLKTRATELKTEVKELWDQFPDIVFLHNA